MNVLTVFIDYRLAKVKNAHVVYPVRNNAPLEFLTGFTYAKLALQFKKPLMEDFDLLGVYQIGIKNQLKFVFCSPEGLTCL